MANLQAPPVRVVNVQKMAANFAQIGWDSVGMNFRYEIEMSSGLELDAMSDYRQITYTDQVYYFFGDDIIQPNAYYQFRVRSVYKGFNPGEWTFSSVVQSNATNAYTFDTMTNFELSKPFTDNFFALNDKAYNNTETGQLYATLMRPDYVFDNTMEWASEAGDYFVSNNGFQVIYPEPPVVCTYQDRVIPTVIDDVIYAFERFQTICKVSNDGGETWHSYNALLDRAGNPVVNCIAQQNTTNTFILGYEYIFQGIRSFDLTFDNDREHWSTVEYTFEELDVENDFGFDTERFTPLAMLPTAITKVAESFSADDYMVVAAAQDKMYMYDIRNPRIETDPSAPNQGERAFNEDEYRITRYDDAVIKKIDFYTNPEIGTDLGTFYFLVPGQWIRQDDPSLPEFGKKIGVDDTVPWRGVYKMNRTPLLIPNPDFDPLLPETEENPSTLVNGYTVTGFSRVYGNTQDELDRINNDSTMSRDEKYLTVGVDYDTWDVQPTTNVPEGASSAVIYYKRQLYTSRQKPRLQQVGTQDGTTWQAVPQDYYGSSHFNWMERNGTRDFKDWENRVVYIRPDTTFDVAFDDSIAERWTYQFDEGTHTFEAPNITIKDFSGYTDGALIHNQVGHMIGYYKFNYRIAAPAPILWNPERLVLTASLVDYTPTVIPDPPEPIDYIVDPELSPLIHKMVPETYIPEDSLFKKFSEYYLKFISLGDGTAYNNLHNLMNSHYARDQHYTEYLYKDMYTRNQVIDQDKREDLTRFFMSRQTDFYSTKGITNSYKFLFKILYDEDVEVEVESLNRFEYFITVESNDVTDDMVGRRIYTPSSSADITYYERTYVNGTLYYKLTLNNLIGSFLVGQVIKTEWDPTFSAMTIEGVQGFTTNYNSDDFKNRSKSYYVMKLRSEVQASQYRDDIIRFVHPVGFGFLGITLLTVLINQGLSIDHVETIVDKYFSMKFDMGAGRTYPTQYPRIDRTLDSPKLQYDANGVLIQESHPKGGLDVFTDTGTTEQEYNDYWDNELWYGTTPADRRSTNSPTWDVSWTRWSELVSNASDRLKDNIGNWYDPAIPSQQRIDDES